LAFEMDGPPSAPCPLFGDAVRAVKLAGPPPLAPATGKSLSRLAFLPGKDVIGVTDGVGETFRRAFNQLPIIWW
jgi:hypothetical protein